MNKYSISLSSAASGRVNIEEAIVLAEQESFGHRPDQTADAKAFAQYLHKNATATYVGALRAELNKLDPKIDPRFVAPKFTIEDSGMTAGQARAAGYAEGWKQAPEEATGAFVDLQAIRKEVVCHKYRK